MGWLAGWIALGLLAAYEAGELATHTGGDWAPVRVLAYLVVSVACLVALARRAVTHARPGIVLPALGICLAGLAAAFTWLYGGAHAAGWTTTALAIIALLLLSLLLSTIAGAMAWRRRVVREEREAVEMVERERRRRLERIMAETTASLAAQADDVADADYQLPTRPKWDESL